jgi:addiction module HigA family antidote
MKIYTDNLLAAQFVHPGFIVEDELEALGVSAAKACKVFNISKEELQQLYDGEIDITPNIADGLEKLGSTESSFWLKLQDSYNTHPKRGGYRAGAGRKKQDFVSKQVRISAPVEEMERIQAWLDTQPNTSRALAELILHAPQN